MNTSLLQQSLDDLLCRILPGQPQPLPPSNGGADTHERHEGLEATRLHLGGTLAADPALTVRVPDDVLPLLTLDDNLTNQLAFPLAADGDGNNCSTKLG
ncbi:hypothetical protein ACIQOV_01020 [Kitasatospora sp. NPDC091257]|uniref:hypothetical protein n=1 Tax=unclassified Kitasatospora TaxID=2633591 RepID=UPI002F91A3F9